MIVLYDNPFSPFARKVRMALHLKDVAFESIDALALGELPRLHAVNPRIEVPVLIDGDVVVADSADIVAYLDDRFPTTPLLPATPALRARARGWQRTADTVLDAVVHDVSLWAWPTHQRHDAPPAGLLDAGQHDLRRILTRLDAALPATGFVCDTLSVADLALFPHVSSLGLLGVALAGFPRVERWNRDMRALPAVQRDIAHLRRSATAAFGAGASPYEGERVVWRGDRIEWLFAHGFHAWFDEELRSGRAVVPRAACTAGDHAPPTG